MLFRSELQMKTGGKPVYRYLYARPRPAYLGIPGKFWENSTRLTGLSSFCRTSRLGQFEGTVRAGVPSASWTVSVGTCQTATVAIDAFRSEGGIGSPSSKERSCFRRPPRGRRDRWFRRGTRSLGARLCRAQNHSVDDGRAAAVPIREGSYAQFFGGQRPTI